MNEKLEALNIIKLLFVLKITRRMTIYKVQESPEEALKKYALGTKIATINKTYILEFMTFEVSISPVLLKCVLQWVHLISRKAIFKQRQSYLRTH